MDLSTHAAETADDPTGSALRVPNFLYVGTSKAGSTWIFDLLQHHPDVFMASGKGLYFFDSHFHYGLDWYLNHFRSAGRQPVLGEVSHSYLYSIDAVRRIADLNPDMKLMVCLREPVERAFSAFLDGVKNGRFAEELSFEQALELDPSLLDRSRYATHLRPYVDRFGVDQIHVADFDELKSDPSLFARKLFDFLDVPQTNLPPSMLKTMMPAGRPRNMFFTHVAKRLSKTARRAGLRRLRTRVKTSRLIRNVLYRPYSTADKPVMRPETRMALRRDLRDEVEQLDTLLGTRFVQKWQ